MIKVFAKLGTDEKIVVHMADKTQIRLLQLTFKNLYGGDWLCVEDVFGSEFVKFNDGQIYKGFEPGKADNFRYCNAIKSVFDEPTN